MTPRIVIALSLCATFVACGGPERLQSRSGAAAGSTGMAGTSGAAGDTSTPATGGNGGIPGTSGDPGEAGSNGGAGGVPGVAGSAATGGTGGTPTGGAGGAPATGGRGGTGGTGGTAGSTTATGGTGGTPTGGAGGTPTGGAGGAATGGMSGGAGGKAGAGGAGGMVGGGPSLKIDAGGLTAMGAWGADMYFAPTPGTTNTHTNTIDVSKVTNPAPEAVYQSARAGTSFTYTVPGYKASSLHTIRLHFCETYFPPSAATSGVGARVCNVTINGNAVLPNYDIFVKAGGKNIAVAEQFVLAADASGQYVMSFVRSSDNCLLAGYEID